MTYSQWTETTAGAFSPVGATKDTINPGYYDLASDSAGNIYFVPVRARRDDLLEFPDSASLTVIEGIRDFWAREEMFQKYGLPFKRGILLYGPPGSGKTCTLQIVSREVVEMGGVVVTFNPALFLSAYRAFREIQPETPMIVLMEDFEGYMKTNYASKILNLLDGVEQLHRVVFLATTNYPEQLEDRIVNRPSRFDLRILVGLPSATARRAYLKALVQEGDEVDIEQYVKDTKNLSLAHLKELFVAVHILGNDYKQTVKRMRSMAVEKVTSLDKINEDEWESDDEVEGGVVRSRPFGGQTGQYL